MSNPDMNAQMNSGLAESLLMVNKLDYKLPPQISIASKCTHVINYSQQASYSNGDTVIFDVQTGSQFVDPACSYLRFVVTPSDSTHCFGSGSAKNLFSRVVVRTATGKELSRVEDANLLMKMIDVYNNSNSWRITLGKNQGYSEAPATNVLADAVPSTGKVFTLPIQCLMPCMSPHGAKLVPPNIMSGLRIELALASPNDAFSQVNQSAASSSLASYTVSNCEMHFKVYELADQFQRKIQEMSQGGLNYLYKEHFHTIVAPGATSNINFDVKKAASKSLTARILARLTTDLTTAGKDRLASSVYNYTKIQSHIGSDYFPNQPLQINDTPDANNISEAYHYALYAQDKLEAWNPTGVTPAQYLGLVNNGTGDVYSSGIVAFNFNKSNVSDLAGYTTSNSRALLVDLTQDSPTNVRLDVYLTFLRLAKVYQSNCVVLD